VFRQEKELTAYVKVQRWTVYLLNDEICSKQYLNTQSNVFLLRNPYTMK